MESYQHDSIAETCVEASNRGGTSGEDDAGVVCNPRIPGLGLVQSGRIGGRGREAGEPRGGGGRVHENKVALSWSYHFAHKMGSLFVVKLHRNNEIVGLHTKKSDMVLNTIW